MNSHLLVSFSTTTTIIIYVCIARDLTVLFDGLLVRSLLLFVFHKQILKMGALLLIRELWH